MKKRTGKIIKFIAFCYEFSIIFGKETFEGIHDNTHALIFYAEFLTPFPYLRVLSWSSLKIRS